jgi:ABC-type nitrate/sulfonate/bicarbonate transport system substrate-binding protein
MQEGYAYAEAHPAAAWAALHTADKTLKDSRLVLQSLRLLRPVVTDAPTIGYQNPSQWKHYAGWLATNKLIPGPVNALQAFTNQFLRSGVK